MQFRGTHSARTRSWRIVIAASCIAAVVLIVVVTLRLGRDEAAVDAANVPTSESRSTRAAPPLDVVTSSANLLGDSERERSEVESAARAPASLHVSVVTPEGLELVDGVVALLRASGELVGSEAVAPFAFEHLAPGEYTVRASEFGGFLDGERSFTIPALNADASRDGPVPVTVELARRARIDVRFVTPDGTPLRESFERYHVFPDTFPWVFASVSSPGSALAMSKPPNATQLGVGVWSKDARERFDGSLEIAVAPPVWVHLICGSAVIESRRLFTLPTELQFVVAPDELRMRSASLTVCVLDEESGAPLADQRGLSVTWAGSRGSLAVWPTDANGCWSVADLPPGPIRLFVQIAGFEHVDRSDVELRAGAHEHLTLRLKPASCIGGTLRDGEGNEVFASVWVGRRSASGLGLERDIGIASGQSTAGVFGICGMAQGDVLLGVDGPGWAANPIEVHVQGRLLENVELLARRGQVVSISADNDRLGLRVAWIEDAFGNPMWSFGSLPSGRLEVTLAPGDYVARVVFGDSTEGTASFTVADSPVHVRVTQ